MTPEKRDQFLHDIKNPLTNIKLTTALLLEGKVGDLTDVQRTLLTASQADCDKMEQLLSQLDNT